jgi:hypothetical protein
MPALLNYTTEIAAEKTVGEIQRKLAQAGASQVLHGYDGAGNLSELSFRIKTQFGEMAFRLPANIEAVEAILTRQFRSGRSKFTSREHVTKVAWRILKDWVKAARAVTDRWSRRAGVRRICRTTKARPHECFRRGLPACY